MLERNRIKFLFSCPNDLELDLKEIPEQAMRWFVCAVQSIDYTPNHLLLVIEDDPDAKFGESLAPAFFGKDIYRNFITDVGLIDRSKIAKTILSHNFKVIDGMAEKRLTNYIACVEKWPYPDMLNVIKIKPFPWTTDMWLMMYKQFTKKP